MSKKIIIGIGGVTNGGKTSLCKYLMEKFPSASTIHMDDYYRPEDDPHHIWLEELKYFNWEVVTAIDFERLVADVKHWISEVPGQSESMAHPPVLLIEGIMIFNNEALMSLFNKKYFFTLRKSQCWERRKLRHYNSWQPDGYFDDVCWPWHVKYKQDTEKHSDVVYVDGGDNQEKNFARIYEDILCKLW